MENKKDALITGAGGFIGSNLVNSLLNTGYRVICLALPDENLEYLSGRDAEILYGDLIKPDQLSKLLPDVQYVFHLAARMGRDDPEFLKKVNIDGSKNLINHYIKNGKKLKRFIFVSSVAAAGPSGISGKLNEESKSNPQSVYGKSKLEVEEYLFKLKLKIPFTIVRLPLVYGPRDRRGLLMLFKIINKGIQLVNINNQFNVGYVKDITKGMILAAESDIALNCKYFLGENIVYSAREIMDSISYALGKKTIKLRIPYWLLYSICYVIEKTCDILGLSPSLRSYYIKSYLKTDWSISVDKAEKELNYITSYPLKRGLKITAEWYKKNGYL